MCGTRGMKIWITFHSQFHQFYRLWNTDALGSNDYFNYKDYEHGLKVNNTCVIWKGFICLVIMYAIWSPYLLYLKKNP